MSNVSKTMHGDYWILKMGKEFQKQCYNGQKITLELDIDEWSTVTVFDAIHRTMLDLERQK